MKNICVVGVGYVGLVTSTCFADLGNHVIALDINAERIENLKQGLLPIYEPGLEEMVKRNVAAGRLDFTTSYAEALKGAEFAFIAVGTPEGVDGEADLQYVRQAAEAIADNMTAPLIIVNKSTVPVGTGDWVAEIVRAKQHEPIAFSVVSCPEFLREGSAIGDFMNPARTVLGSLDPTAAHRVAELHLALRATIVVVDLRTAEMIKYASNAFLATKISFINEIANICEALGADVKEVAAGMGYDPRIGRSFLDAGLGYGGSCFEANETVFTLNSPNVAAEKLETVFENGGEAFQGDEAQVVTPADKRVLAFDLETGQPALAEITAVTRRPYHGTLVTLTTGMGRALKVTADHPVIVSTPAGLNIVPAAAVAPGDQLLALSELPATEQPTRLNLIELLEGTALERDVHVTAAGDAFTAQFARFAGYIPSDWLRNADEIRQRNAMPLRLYHYLTALGVLDVPAETLQLYTAKGATTRINAALPVDADLLRLCGYYLAVGYLSEAGGQAGAARKRVSFRFNEDEAESAADAQRILGRWGLKFSERRGTHASTTSVSSGVLAWLVGEVLKCGTGPSDKALPRLAFNVPAELRFELARGVFSGAGTINPLEGGGNLTLEYATASKRLADGMALLLQTLGVVAAIRQRSINKSTGVGYTLSVSGYAQLETLRDAFGGKGRALIDGSLAGHQSEIKPRGFARQGPAVALTVLAVEYDEVDTTVYSVETSTGTLIASSGLICHNCFPKDVKALAHMANVQGRHPQLLLAVMDINHDQRRLIVDKVRDQLGGLEGKRVGLFGLAFKPNTDDMRDAPAIEIAQMLQAGGASVQGYDPVAMVVAARHMPGVRLCEDAYEAATDADAVIICTEWNEFKQLNLARLKQCMRRPVIVDGRNIYDPAMLGRMGFHYRGMGRGYDGNGPRQTEAAAKETSGQ